MWENVHSRIDRTGYEQWLHQVNVGCGQKKLSHFTIGPSVSFHLFQQAWRYFCNSNHKNLQFKKGKIGFSKWLLFGCFSGHLMGWGQSNRQLWSALLWEKAGDLLRGQWGGQVSVRCTLSRARPMWV